MRYLLVILVLVSAFRTMGQSVNTTVRVVEMPEIYTPILDTLYLAGDPNDWNPSDQNSRFDMSGEFPELTLTGEAGEPFEFKITRGYGWSTVEANEDGSFRPNRIESFQEGVIEVSILGWEEFPAPLTASPQTQVLSSNFYMPELDRYRRIWIVLPSGYNESSESYPVIYMHDAQNLFSAGNSFAGEWEVDETMLDLESLCLEAIVVGIDNGEALRIDEYAPWVNTEYDGGEGDEYSSFLVNTLKPFIDQEFRTLSDAENTAIIGSSLGALISCYAAKAHPDVFGKVGLFSPAFWFNPEIFDFVQNATVSTDQRFYLIAGENESSTMLPLMNQMVNDLNTSGHPQESIYSQAHSDGQHSEWYWAREFPDALEWLFCEDNNSIPEWEIVYELKSYPNPSSDSLTIEFDTLIETITIVDMQAKVVFTQNDVRKNRITISHDWPSGTYGIKVTDKKGLVYHLLHTIE